MAARTYRVILYMLYVFVVFMPFVLAAAIDLSLLTPSVAGLADATALVALAILVVQPLLSARLRWIERPFGLDRLVMFHRVMAMSALVLLCAHPLLLAAGDYGWPWLLDSGVSWSVWTGKAALLALVTIAVTSLGRAALRLRYETWLRLHDVLALGIVTGGVVHAWAIGPHCSGTVVRTVLVGYAATALGAWLYRHVWRDVRAWGTGVVVTEVRQETPRVWTLRLALPSGRRPYDYLPGQFHFVTLRRACGGPVEQHPFTISSSPSDPQGICSTIKATGDYTATIGKTAPGDRARLDGPYGRFSYVLYPDERELVFVAGGIGITPFMSMLRHMRETQAALEVVLFYANRTEQDIVFREELEMFGAGDRPRLRVIHVLSRAGPAWSGERGRVSIGMIRRVCKELQTQTYYICGPKPMMKELAAELRAAGVNRRRIRVERFSF